MVDCWVVSGMYELNIVEPTALNHCSSELKPAMLGPLVDLVVTTGRNSEKFRRLLFVLGCFGTLSQQVSHRTKVTKIQPWYSLGPSKVVGHPDTSWKKPPLGSENSLQGPGKIRKFLPKERMPRDPDPPNNNNSSNSNSNIPAPRRV